MTEAEARLEWLAQAAKNILEFVPEQCHLRGGKLVPRSTPQNRAINALKEEIAAAERVLKM